MSESDSKATEQRELRGVLPAGTQLRSYHLIAVLGQGSFGITYRARDRTLGRDVAIKEYLPTSLALREDGTTVVPRSAALAEEFVWGRERFLDEARTLATLDHVSAVVRVFDFLEANGTAYMVMALVQGETLDQRLNRDGHLPQPIIERLLYPLLDGLEEVHATGFLHRDIKPANIILDAKDNPTLIDFGASRAAMVGGTTAMTAIFTPGYAAAEQFTSAKQGPWTDIYGLSATLYHAITGKAPPSAFDRMLDDTYEPLGGLRPMGFPPALLAGIDAGLIIRGSDRPQSVSGWRMILSHAEATSRGEAATEVLHRPRPIPPPAAPTQTASPPQANPAVASDAAPASSTPPAKRKRQTLWAGVVVAVMALGGAVYFMFTPNKPTLVSSASQSLTAEELTQALADPRKADAVAAEKRRLEDVAQSTADADAASKRAADGEPEEARLQRKKAEAELVLLKAEMESRRKAEAAQREQAAVEEAARRNKAETEVTALHQAEEESKRKAAADAMAKTQADEAAQRKAEADTAALRQAEVEANQGATAEAIGKQQADEALAKAQMERQRADDEVKQKAEAEAEAKQKAEAETKQKAEAAAFDSKVAEAAEIGLRLGRTDRQRIQVALTSLSFDTRGIDGTFGPRSREKIAEWQSARNQPPTGFLTSPQHQALLREAATALSKYDDEKKIEEEKKKADEVKRKAEDDAKLRAVAQPPLTAPAASPPSAFPAGAAAASSFDGEWRGSGKCGRFAYAYIIVLTIQNNSAIGTAKLVGPSKTAEPELSFLGTVNPSSGAITLSVASNAASRFSGKINGSRLTFKGWTGEADCEFALDRLSSKQ